MKYTVYIATSLSKKIYVGITNNFKRRLKEHGSSPYPFGRAIRKYGKDNFSFEFIPCNNIDQAYRIESELIGPAEVKSRKFYNISCGGQMDIQFGDANPMRNPEVVKRHTGMWTSEKNPMRQEKNLIAHRLRTDKLKKSISVDGVVYKGVRNAAKLLGTSSQALGHRVKSPNFPNTFLL